MGDAKRWVMVIVFPILGIGGLWWAGRQLESIRTYVGLTFDFWPEWRLLGYYLTIIAVGALFSLAASAAGIGRSHAHTGLTLVAAALPSAIVVYAWGHLAFGWFPTLGGEAFPLGPIMSYGPASPAVIASCVLVGFLLTGLVTSRLSWSR